MMQWANNNFLRATIALAALLATGVCSILTSSLTPIFFFLLFLFIVFAISRQAIWAVSIFALHFSELRLPFFPKTLTMSELAMITIIPLLLANKLIYNRNTSYNLAKLSAIAFGIVTVATMVLRKDFGVRALGSSSWGGAAYVYLLSSMVLFLWIETIEIRAKTWQKGLAAMALLALLPVVSNLIFVASDAQFYWQFLFVNDHLMTMRQFQTFDPFGGVGRLVTWYGLYLLFFPFVMHDNPFSAKNRPSSLVFIFVSLLLVCASGYRVFFINTFLIMCIWSLLVRQKGRMVRFIALSAAAASAMILLIFFAEHMPAPFQRIVANIPFANVSNEVKMDAIGSISWRIEVWHRAKELIPQYLWLGRGITYKTDVIPTMTADFDYAIFQSALEMGDFHNAFISLLICFGIPGLITFFTFLIASTVRYWKLAARPDLWASPLIFRLYLIMASWFFSEVLIFVCIYGEIKGSAAQFFMQAALLEGLIACNKRECRLLAQSKMTNEQQPKSS